jgi:O-antigen/teichoic acid export membrane protein
MIGGAVRRARAQVADPLMRGAYSLITNTALVAALGVIFWIAAARLFPAQDIGRDSALIAAMMTISGIAQLNMANAVPRFLPRATDPARVLRLAYLASAGAAVLLATAFLAVVPRFVDELGSLLDEPLLAIGFVVATVVWGVFVIQDAALAAVRRAPLIPIENAVYGVLKLLALPLFLALGAGFGIFQSWVLPVVLLLVPVNILLFRSAIPAHRRRHPATAPAHGEGRRILRFLALDYAGSALAFTGAAVLPLLVLSLLGPEQSAYFYVSFIIVNSIDMFGFNGGTAVVVESALDERRLRANARTMVRRLLPIMMACTAAVVFGAQWILAPFGAEYVDGGSTLLRLLGCAILFRGVTTLFAAIARVQRRGRALLALDAFCFALGLALTCALAPAFGLTGVGIAWLASAATAAIVVLPGVVAFMRGNADDAADDAARPPAVVSP